MTNQQWIDEAAFHLEEKRALCEHVQSTPGMPPEAVECAKNLVLLCEILLMQAVAKYLKAV